MGRGVGWLGAGCWPPNACAHTLSDSAYAVKCKDPHCLRQSLLRSLPSPPVYFDPGLADICAELADLSTPSMLPTPPSAHSSWEVHNVLKGEKNQSASGNRKKNMKLPPHLVTERGLTKPQEGRKARKESILRSISLRLGGY